MANFYHNDELYIDIDEDLDFSTGRPYYDYYDEDELGAFNEELATLVEHLKQAVAKNIKDELESLRKENTELRDIKENWEDKTRELSVAVINYNQMTKQAEENAKRAKLSELVRPFLSEAYKVETRFEYIREKCDKCDIHGYRHYTTPLGREATELCDCREKLKTYHVEPVKLWRLSDDTWSHGIRATFTYREDSDTCLYETSSNVYNGEPFDSPSFYAYQPVFLNKEDAEKYREYLIEKENGQQ